MSTFEEVFTLTHPHEALLQCIARSPAPNVDPFARTVVRPDQAQKNQEPLGFFWAWLGHQENTFSGVWHFEGIRLAWFTEPGRDNGA